MFALPWHGSAPIQCSYRASQLAAVLLMQEQQGSQRLVAQGQSALGHFEAQPSVPLRKEAAAVLAAAVPVAAAEGRFTTSLHSVPVGRSTGIKKAWQGCY